MRPYHPVEPITFWTGFLALTISALGGRGLVIGGEANGNGQWNLGQILAFAAMILLLLSYVLGGSKPGVAKPLTDG